jgi:hypothetical protein
MTLTLLGAQPGETVAPQGAMLRCISSSITGQQTHEACGYPVLRFKNAKVFWLNSLTFS